MVFFMFNNLRWDYGVLTPFSKIFQLYRGSQYYCWRKLEHPENTTDKLLSHNVVSSIHLAMSGHDLGTDCIGSCKSNYHMITALMAPQWFEVWGDCSFCWYWWNCWPSGDHLLNLLFIITAIFSYLSCY